MAPDLVQAALETAQSGDDLFILACLLECYASDAVLHGLTQPGVAPTQVRASIASLQSSAAELAGGPDRGHQRNVIRRIAADLQDVLRGGVRFANRPEVLEGCPVDLAAYGAAIAELGSRLPAPLAIVGLRSSGSVLAPVAAAAVQQTSYSTIRPLPVRVNYFEPRTAAAVDYDVKESEEVAALERTSPGTVLVLDDLVGSGTTTALAVEALRRAFPSARFVIVVLSQTSRRTVRRILENAVRAEVHVMADEVVSRAAEVPPAWERLGPSSFHRAFSARSGIPAERLHMVDVSPHARRYRSTSSAGSMYHRYVGSMPAALRIACGLPGLDSWTDGFASAVWVEGEPLDGHVDDADGMATPLTNALAVRWLRFGQASPLSDPRRFMSIARSSLVKALTACGILAEIPDRVMSSPPGPVERFFFPDNVAPWHFLSPGNNQVGHVSGVVRHDARFVDPIGEAIAFAVSFGRPEVLGNWLEMAPGILQADAGVGRVFDAALEAMWFALCRAKYFDARGEWIASLANRRRPRPNDATLEEPSLAQTAAHCRSVASAVLAFLPGDRTL
jgi:adenine/guanine phosphoribosyltransferase-like PRPP-binding protein